MEAEVTAGRINFFQKAIAAITSRALGAGLSFLISVIAVRALGASVFGQIAVAYSTLVALGFLARFGADNWQLQQGLQSRRKTQSQYTKSEQVKLPIIITIFGSLAAFLTFSTLTALNVKLPIDITSPGLLLLVLLCVLGNAVTSLLVVDLKLRGNTTLSNLVESLFFQTALLAPVLFLRDRNLELATYLSAYTVNSLLVIAIILAKYRSAESESIIVSKRLWPAITECFPYVLSGLGSFLLRWSPPIISALIYENEEIGNFNFEFRISLIVYILATAINSVTVHTFRQDAFSSRISLLRYITWTMAVSIAVTLIAYHFAPLIWELGKLHGNRSQLALALLCGGAVMSGASLQFETSLVAAGRKQALVVAYYSAASCLVFLAFSIRGNLALPIAVLLSSGCVLFWQFTYLFWQRR